MIATAKIVAKKFPDYKKVFIGPCPVKKIEAKEGYPELEILVLTYKEIAEVFKIKNISSKLTKKLTDPEYDVISGPALAVKTIQEFSDRPDLRVLDILYKV